MPETGEVKHGIAVIDDDEAALFSIAQVLKLRGYDVKSFLSAEEALAWPGLWRVDCVLTDVKMPHMSGEELLAEITKLEDHPPVIMVTGHGDVAMAVRCLKTGAYDFIEKPPKADMLLASVGRAVEKSMLTRESDGLRRKLQMLSSDEIGRFGLIGRSRVMQELYQRIEVIARTNAPVLILGETGVGKELVARAIHAQSARADGPFVPVNAGGLPDTMLQSELFGHVRGAFTGAERDRDGKLVTASGGTLLLDEVESISVLAQIQLLRVLEDGIVTPLGSDKPVRVDIRLLCTTKIDLKDEVKRGTMREDYYHRIAVVTVRVPPLRERPDDVPLLVAHFLKRTAERDQLPVPRVPDAVLSELMYSQWPGNVRELRNAVERMVITAQGGTAGAFGAAAEGESDRLLSLPSHQGRLRQEMEQTERQVIDAALRENAGEINATSRSLGISRRALYERMKKYGLDKDDYKN